MSNVIIELIKQSDKSNTDAHSDLKSSIMAVKEEFKVLNSSVKTLKTNMTYIKGLVFGIIVALIATGTLPEQAAKLFNKVF